MYKSSPEYKKKQAGYARKHYLANKEVMKKRAQTSTLNKRRKQKELVKEYLLKHPCIECGESNPIVLDFDHRGNKEANICDIVSNKGWSTERLLAEISKCDVRCANCHRVKTYKESGRTIYDLDV